MAFDSIWHFHKYGDFTDPKTLSSFLYGHAEGSGGYCNEKQMFESIILHIMIGW